MNTNLLLAISVMMVGIILISINYESISDFYNYVVPLNSFVIEQWPTPSDSSNYQTIKQQDDSTCFTTPANNEYCYTLPRGDEDFRVSYPFGFNGINGEMHLEPANNATGYWTMSKIVPISDDIGIIIFSDNSNRYPPETLARWHITEEFEFTRTVEKYDTFVSHCSNNGKHIELMQYLGVITVEGIDYVATWHMGANSEQEITCKYPQVIQYSFGHDFGV